MRLYEIKFLNDAKLDLRRVYSRVCTTSGSSARASKVVGRIRKEVDKLAYMPERNALYTVYETTLIYRHAKVGKYVVLYTVDNDNGLVDICRIVDSRRDMRYILK